LATNSLATGVHNVVEMATHTRNSNKHTHTGVGVAAPMHAPSRTSLLFPPPSFTQSPSPPRSLVRDGQPSPHRPRLVVARSTCPPISPPPPHANSFVLGPAVINTHTPATLLLVCRIPCSGQAQCTSRRDFAPFPPQPKEHFMASARRTRVTVEGWGKLGMGARYVVREHGTTQTVLTKEI
jgi:hypothetical protein